MNQTKLENAKRIQEQAPEKKALAQSKIDRYAKLKSDRINFEVHWQDCYEMIVPRKEDVISNRMQGDKRNDNLYDSTAIKSNQMLAATLSGMLTNTETRFFDLQFGDPVFDDDDLVKGWLQEVADRMFTVLNSTNFHTETHEVYIDLGAIGTSCIYMGEHDEKIIHFNARAMKEIVIDENNLGVVNYVGREFKWQARNIVEEFGEDNLPYEVLKAYKDGSSDSWDILHVTEPKNKDQESGKNKHFTYLSTYMLKEHAYILSESGYREFPYAVPRWTKTTGEKYGRGPGMDMLPDIRMLQAMKETTIKGAQKVVDPPLQVSDDSVIGQVRLTPGGLTVVRPGSDPIKPLITNANVDFGFQNLEAERKSIKEGFYEDLSQLGTGPQMTAEEVQQRTREKLQLMGPILARQHSEFLSPVIERTYAIMARRKMIPAAPAKIQGKSFHVKYSSLIARAQRMSEGQNLTRALSMATPLIQVIPATLDNVDGDKALKYIFDINGVPKKIMRTQREIDMKRKQQQAAEAKAAQEKEQQHQADLAQKAAPMVAAAGQLQKNQEPQVK